MTGNLAMVDVEALAEGKGGRSEEGPGVNLGKRRNT